MCVFSFLFSLSTDWPFLAVKVWSLNHWTSREVLALDFYTTINISSHTRYSCLWGLVLFSDAVPRAWDLQWNFMFTIWLDISVQIQVLFVLAFSILKIWPHLLLACVVAIVKSNFTLIDGGVVLSLWRHSESPLCLWNSYMSMSMWVHLLSPQPCLSCHSMSLLLWDPSSFFNSDNIFLLFLLVYFFCLGSPLIHLLPFLLFISLGFFPPFFLPSRRVFIQISSISCFCPLWGWPLLLLFISHL